jgi:hypothetical protein
MNTHHIPIYGLWLLPQGRLSDWLVFLMWCLIFGVPGGILFIAWRRLFRNWQKELHETADVACLILVSASALLAIASSVWEVLVRPIPPHHYAVLIWAWAVSCAAVVAGLIPQKGQHQHFGLGLVASFWMLVVWSLTAFAY